ncbi:unnamed protein product [Linum tenue]|uniref:TF-B3 domain-containing protein n=2 Tax=Linum tenue TaxID=586396 RepID=A0AAV0I7S6_9ROSI|nr:unnamed protein product [Linum tenue]
MNFGQEEEDDSRSKDTAAASAEEAVVVVEENDELDEEEEDDYASAIPTPNLHSPPVHQYENLLPQHHHHDGLWRNLSQTTSSDAAAAPSAAGFNFVDLSLAGSSNEADPPDLHGRAAGPSSTTAAVMVEKEHMFDKVVTPSDVGKLNRLVIPKQHAEKYFPLDSSSNEKGLLLNFEDRGGKPWRFRYSYWNSSQSYVMTKGWSRFVKEKKLDAGDIVSFQRGVGEAGKHRLYIDWRRRPAAPPDPMSFPHHHFDLHNNPLRWGRLYSLPPQSISNLPPRQWDYPHPPPPQFHHQQLNYGTILPLQNSYGHNQYYHNYQQPLYYSRPPGATAQYPISASSSAAGIGGGGDHVPMVIDSVPVVHGKTVGKRLRLFGVNMECQPDDLPSFSPASPSSSMSVTYPYQQQQRGTMSSSSSSLSPSSSIPGLQFQGVPTTATPPSQMAMHHHQQQQQQQHEYSKKGKTSSLSFDLDL